MSDAILAQLKIKEKPKEQKEFLVQFKKPQQAEEKKDININIPVIDKRKTSELDRRDILSKIKEKTTVEKTIQQQEINISTIKDTIPEEQDKPEELSIKNPVKKTKKVKLVLQKEKEEEEEGSKEPSERKTVKPQDSTIAGPASLLQFGDITSRLHKKEPNILLRSSAYYMNNREIFTNFISSLFNPYKKEIEESTDNYSCDKSGDNEFTLLTHQKLVRDYLNIETPYRGLLFYHGLGSGKTCSSIGVAEGLKTDKQIIVMTPASLRVNYIEELKKCGDKLYRKNQYWEFIDTVTNPELLEPLSNALSIPTQFIKKNNGAWLVNSKITTSNYDKLSSLQQLTLDNQLNEMIKYKYQFINYNGLRFTHLNKLTINNTINPFTNKVVIIDEAHNFVSRIVNKLKRPESLAMKLYEYLMTAENTRIVLLTGTPIINYPNEIGITMNILRGKIKTWSMKLSISEERKLSQELLIDLFKSYSISNNILDYLQYKATSTTLVITRNPYGFFSFNNSGKSDEKKKLYEGVTMGEDGNVSDSDFLKIITKILNENNIKIIAGSVKVDTYNCLPDNLENFSAEFIESDSSKIKISSVKNMNKFKRRILGLTSYFPDIDALLPKYEKEKDYFVKKIPMSDFQFSIYEEARVQERKIEKNNAKKRKQKGSEIYDDAVSTYRIFSRAFCNFVFPRPDITRPLPREDDELSSVILQTAEEDILDAVSIDEKLKDTDGKYDIDDLEQMQGQTENIKLNKKYEDRIQLAINKLKENSDKYLTPTALETYSPKFLNILENIIDESNLGLHLMYSQFRTLEGIGIFSLILQQNGFARFQVKKEGENWKINIDLEDKGKPCFVLYTGTESSEEKEVLRNIFNGDWDVLQPGLREELESISSNNLYGEIIKVIMITASGAEGISLKNVRFVHITEPYWHPVRIEQVIGRARRICSHKDLPSDLQTVQVILYLMTFSESQLTDDKYKELRLKDKSKIDNTTPLTSDEALDEIARIKENINKEILQNVKEAAIDCNIHTTFGGKEKLTCFSFPGVNPDKFSYSPSIFDEETDAIADKNKIEKKIKAFKVTIPEIGDAAWDKETGAVYTLDSYKRKPPVQIGTLEIKKNKETGLDEYNFIRI